MNHRLILIALTGLGLLAACTPTMASMSHDMAPVAAQAATPAAAPAAPVTITMKLTEWTMGMDMSPMKAKGPVMFMVENVGKFPHALAVEGKIGGKDFELSTIVLKPGEKTSLMVQLPPGTYNVYCPVGKHEAQGMKADLIIE